ncbi:MAG: hypothetical protein WDZ44_01955, partial [Candidatus Spechtbacterales bacterium]
DPSAVAPIQDDVRLIEGSIIRWIITKEAPKKERNERPARVRKTPKTEEGKKEETPNKETQSVKKGEDDVTLEDIDKKLDEIMGTL